MSYRLLRRSPLYKSPLAALSLRVKLTLGYALIFGVTALIFTLGVLLIARTELRAAMDATLQVASQTTLPQVVGEGSAARFGTSARPSSDVALDLLGPQGQVLDWIGNHEQALPPTLHLGFSTAAGQRVYVTARPGGYLRASRSSDLLSELLETLGRVMLLSAAALVLVACLAGYWLADRALRPVDMVARTAGRIARQGAYRERVPAAPGRDEMARLTGTVNEMLDRLQGTIEREQAFARTAAHELRTPLTALKGRVELALSRPREAAEYRRNLESMARRVDDLITLSESLLALARAEVPVRLERVELGAAALEAADQLEPDTRVHLDAEESWVLAEGAGVRQVIVNLLSNAQKYASGPVTLTVRNGEICVQDSGVGPPQAEWARLTRPFERGRNHQGAPGSGLGLALVAVLVSRWDAQLLPEWRADGFATRVRWRPQPPDAAVQDVPNVLDA